MPLRCLDTRTDESILAFDLIASDWQALRTENKIDGHLRMPCCSAGVVLKTSKYGLQFFAHKAERDCQSAPETESHLHLKRMAVEAARANGWNASSEVGGSDPDGHHWVADVFATRGDHRVAVEIQWSGQTPEETLARQDRYRRSGVRGLWLLRQPGFPVSKQLPAVCIGGTVASGFVALIPEHERMKTSDRDHADRWRQSLPMNEFFNAVFQRRFQHGLRENAPMTLSIRLGDLVCWHPECGGQTTIISAVTVKTGDLTFDLAVSNFISHEKLLEQVASGVERRRDIGAIKVRWSQTQRRNYLSNGCRHCDRLVGEHFEHLADRLHEVTGKSSGQLTREWIKIVERAYPDHAGWGVR